MWGASRVTPSILLYPWNFAYILITNLYDLRKFAVLSMPTANRCTVEDFRARLLQRGNRLLAEPIEMWFDHTNCWRAQSVRRELTTTPLSVDKLGSEGENNQSVLLSFGTYFNSCIRLRVTNKYTVKTSLRH
jgi:hypothetical protein